jgi:hypothetical protein
MRSARSRASSLPIEIMRPIGETYAAADPEQAGLQARSSKDPTQPAIHGI